MEGTWFDNIAPEDLRRVKQSMIEHLRRNFPEIYGDLKDEPEAKSNKKKEEK